VTGTGNAYAQTAGTTNIAANGALSAPNVNVTGGTLRGNGTVAGNLNLTSAGTVEGVNPNNGNADILTVNGSYNQNGGTLAALLQGTGAGQIGQAHLTNGTSLNLNGGNLARAPGSINYAAGQTFSNVVTFQPGQLFGTFTQLEGLGNGVSANLGGGLTLEALYNNAAGNVTLQVVNTPASNTITWNDGTGNWTTDTTKWTPNGPPVPTSDVVIGSDADQPRKLRNSARRYDIVGKQWRLDPDGCDGGQQCERAERRRHHARRYPQHSWHGYRRERRDSRAERRRDQ